MFSKISVLIISLLFPFLTFAYDNGIVDEMVCMSELKSQYVELKITHTVFDITNCMDTEIDQDLEYYFTEISSYEFEWLERRDSVIEDAIDLLATNHESQDGSIAYSNEEVQSVIDFYRSGHADKKVNEGDYAETFMGGTGITSLVFLFNKEKTQMIMIKKFTYAE